MVRMYSRCYFESFLKNVIVNDSYLPNPVAELTLSSYEDFFDAIFYFIHFSLIFAESKRHYNEPQQHIPCFSFRSEPERYCDATFFDAHALAFGPVPSEPVAKAPHQPDGNLTRDFSVKGFF